MSWKDQYIAQNGSKIGVKSSEPASWKERYKKRLDEYDAEQEALKEQAKKRDAAMELANDMSSSAYLAELDRQKREGTVQNPIDAQKRSFQFGQTARGYQQDTQALQAYYQTLPKYSMERSDALRELAASMASVQKTGQALQAEAANAPRVEYQNKQTKTNELLKKLTEENYLTNLDADKRAGSYQNPFDAEKRRYQYAQDAAEYRQQLDEAKAYFTQNTGETDAEKKLKLFRPYTENAQANRSILQGISDQSAQLGATGERLTQDAEYWKSFENEDAYDLAMRQLEIEKRKKQAEQQVQIDAQNKAYTAAGNGSLTEGLPMTQYLREQFNADAEKNMQIDTGADELAKTAMIDPATRSIRMINSPLSDMRDFQEYAAKGAAIKNPDYSGWNNWNNSVKNKVEYGRKYAALLSPNFNRGDYEKYYIYTFMSQGEVDEYNYLLAKDGEKTADQYIEMIRPVLNQRQAEAEKKSAADFAESHPLGASVASVALGTAAGAGFIAQGIKKIFGGDIDPNDEWNSAARIQNTIRGTVANKISENHGGVSAFLYQTGMSMADSAVGMALSGGSSWIASSIMGLNAAENAMLDAVGRGANDTQALLSGLFSGIAEAVFEKFSIESLFTMKGSGLKDLIKNVLKQGAIEGSEEFATEVANLWGDWLVMGGKSQFDQALASYQAQGLSFEDAKAKALLDVAKQIGLDTAGGVLSGLVFAGAKTGLNALGGQNMETNVNAQQTQGSGGRSFETDPMMQYATEAQAKQDEIRAAEAQNKPVQGVLPVSAINNTSEKQTPVTASNGLLTADQQRLYDSLEFAGESKESLAKFRENAIAQNAKGETKIQRPKSYANITQKFTDAAYQKLDAQTKARVDTSFTVMDAMAKRAGVKINVVDSISATVNGKKSAGNARYNPADNSIDISLDAHDGAYEYVATHELVHHIQSKNEAEYGILDDVVSGVLTANGEDVDALVKDQMNRFGYDEKTAREEVIANSIPAVLNDETTVRRLVETDRNLAQRIADFIQQMLADIKAAGEKLMQRAGWKQMQSLTRDTKNLREIGDLFIAALEDTRMMAEQETETRRESTAEDDEVPFSLKTDGVTIEEHALDSYSGQTDLVITGKIDGKTVGTLEYSEYQGTPSIQMIKVEPEYRRRGIAKQMLQALQKKYGDTEIEFGMSTNEGTELLKATTYDVENKKYATLKKEYDAITKELQVREDKFNAGTITEEEEDSWNDLHDRQYEIEKQINEDGLKPKNTYVRYSIKDTDSEGNKLTDAQREYFKDSKVVDDQGRLVPVYHGTANEFNVFDKATIENGNGAGAFRDFKIGKLGFYFTNDIEYARELTHEKNKGYADEKIIKAYVNLKNPLIVSDAGWGNAVRQTDIRESDLRRWAKDGKHDGIIVESTDETIYDGNGKEVTEKVIIAFNPEQIKRTDNHSPTTSPDIRFSLKDVEPDTSVESLVSENAQLKQANALLQEQFKLTQGNVVDKADIAKLARMVKREYQSDIDYEDLTANLEQLFTVLSNSSDPAAVWPDIQSNFMGIGNQVIEQSKAKDTTMTEYYKPARELLKGRITLNEGQKAEAASITGNLADYRKRMFGMVNLANEGIPLDTVWQELSDLAPDLFPADISDADMPAYLMDAVEMMRPQYVNPYEMNRQEAANDVMMRVFQAYMELPKVQTFADKQKAKYNAQLDKYRTMMEKYRDDVKTKYAERLKAVKLKSLQERQALSVLLKQETNAKMKERLRRQYIGLASSFHERLEANRARYAKWVNNDRAREKYLPSVEKNVKELATWLMKPTDAKHVPEKLKGVVNDFISTLDFAGDKTTKRAEEWRERMRDLGEAMREVDSGDYENLNFYAEVDPDFVPTLKEFMDETEGVRYVKDLDGRQLTKLNYLVNSVKQSVTYANRLQQNARYQTVAEAGERSMQELDLRKEAKQLGKYTGMARDLLNTDQLDATAYQDQLGLAGGSLIHELRNGLDTKVNDVRKTEEFTKGLIGKTDLKYIDTQKQTFTVSGGKVELTVAEVMSLYCLDKRQQAKGHIYDGGIKTSKMSRPAKVTPADVAAITGTLTAEEKQIADGLQQYMSTEVSGWGNETSMNLYGYQKFTENDYFPIKSDENYVRSTDDESKGEGFYRLKNLGMTKSTVKGARNALIVSGIMDVFTKHIDDMSSYHGFVIPISDAMKYFNYKGEAGSVKESIGRALGYGGKKYFTTLIKDINGVKMETGKDIGETLLRNAKLAAVGANLRVVIQQPTAYMRAMNVISPKYLMQGLTKLPSIAKAKKFCPIAQWKAYGFYDLDIGKGLKEILLGSETVGQKVRNAALAPAQMADEMTWGYLWNAAEFETKAKHPELDVRSNAFNEAVGKRLSEIVDRTQVVDSVFHRSQVMRKKGISQFFTSFMSEPTKTYNMARTAIAEVARNPQDKAARAKLLRAVSTYALTGIFTAAASALIDAVRDTDKDEEGNERSYSTKYGKAFGSNVVDILSPLNMIPYLREIQNLTQGFKPNRLDMRGVEFIWNAATNWQKWFSGNSTKSVYGLVYQTAQGMSYLTGVPVSNAMRAFDGAYYTLTGKQLDKENETATAEKSFSNLYAAYVSGNKTKINQLTNTLRAGTSTLKPKSPSDIDSGVAEQLMLNDARIADAYKAKADGNARELLKIKNVLVKEGFTGEMVDKAVARYEAVAKPPKPEDLDKELDAKLFNNEDMANAIIRAATTGDEESMKLVYSELLADSKAADPEKAIRSGITEYVKPIYLSYYDKADDQTMFAIENVLIINYGYSSKDFTAWIKDYEKAKLD